MGKNKKRKINAQEIATQNDQVSNQASPSVASEEAIIAADGRRMDGWTAADVKIYNDLLDERSKLEKEKRSLEHNAEKASTERALNESTKKTLEDLFFKEPTGEYKFHGANVCCIHVPNAVAYARARLQGSTMEDTPCHHEICSRAKTKGISWTEMDTIKYYEMRIFKEKSERLRKALRKQMGVELIRIKKVEDEEAASKARKTALLDKADREALRRNAEKLANGEISKADYQRDAVLEAAQQNDSQLTSIRIELEGIKKQVDAGKVTSSDLRTKLDAAQAKMTEAERRNNLFRQMILEVEGVRTSLDGAFDIPSGLDKDLKKLCQTAESAVAQAMSILKDFFSASGPEQMEDTMGRLKSTLEARGPMPKKMSHSFKELENMVAESKARGVKMDFKVDFGGTVTGGSMIDTMLALRKKLRQGTISADSKGKKHRLDKELIEANQGCLDVEEVAEAEMVETAKKLADCMTPTTELAKALIKIKDDAAAKSPIPPLSDIMLETRLQRLLDIHDAELLLHHIHLMSDSELAAFFTSRVIKKAGKKPEQFEAALTSMRVSLEIVTKYEVPPRVKHEFEKVEKSMKAWADRHAAKKAKEAAEAAPEDKATAVRKSVGKVQAPFVAGLKEISQQLAKNPEKKLDDRVAILIEEFLRKIPRTTWLLSKLLRFSLQLCLDADDPPLLGEVIHLDIKADEKNALSAEDYVRRLYSKGICPTISGVFLSNTLADRLIDEPKRGQRDLIKFHEILPDLQEEFEEKWYKGLHQVSCIMMFFYTGLFKTVARKFGEQCSSSLQITADAVAWVMAKVLITPQEEPSVREGRSLQAVDVLHVFAQCLGGDDLDQDLSAGLGFLEDTWFEVKGLCTVSDCVCQKVCHHREGVKKQDSLPVSSIRKWRKEQREPPVALAFLGKPEPIQAADENETLKEDELSEEHGRQVVQSEAPSWTPDMATPAICDTHELVTADPVKIISKVSDRRRPKAVERSGGHTFLRADEALPPDGHCSLATPDFPWLPDDKFKKAVEGCLETARLYVRTFEAAKLRVPLNLLLATHRLDVGLDDWNKSRKPFEKTALEDVHNVQEYYNDEASILCGCEGCLKVFDPSYADDQEDSEGVSRFTEQFYSDIQPAKNALAQQQKVFAPATETQRKQAAKLARQRAREISHSQTTPQYLTYVVNNLIREALTFSWPHTSWPFVAFEDLITYHRRLPKVLEVLLDQAKARLMNVPYPEILSISLCLDDPDSSIVEQDFATLIQHQVTYEGPIFLTTEQWNCRKLTLWPKKVLSDAEFYQVLFSALMDIYADKGKDYALLLVETLQEYDRLGVGLPSNLVSFNNGSAPNYFINYSTKVREVNQFTIMICIRLQAHHITIPKALREIFMNKGVRNFNLNARSYPFTEPAAKFLEQVGEMKQGSILRPPLPEYQARDLFFDTDSPNVNLSQVMVTLSHHAAEDQERFLANADGNIIYAKYERQDASKLYANTFTEAINGLGRKIRTVEKLTRELNLAFRGTIDLAELIEGFHTIWKEVLKTSRLIIAENNWPEEEDWLEIPEDCWADDTDLEPLNVEMPRENETVEEGTAIFPMPAQRLARTLNELQLDYEG